MKGIIMCLTIMFLMVACAQPQLTGAKPPATKIEIDNEVYETELGTYCWNTGCVDTVGSVEMLKGKTAISVAPGEVIKLVMNYKPMPSHFSVTQIRDGNISEVMFENQQFNAPAEKGLYYYTIGIWWKDEKQENVSHGDAFYHFLIEVK